ncbi:MAG: hypothetical protein GY804_04650 [Alphaproteobacteria bacterium]|nr:hypothetical protein [Alphaproteobacteria bacterium]
MEEKIKKMSDEEARDILKSVGRSALPVDKNVIPTIRYCPYCGGRNLKLIKQVPRCYDCRCTFFVNFSRSLRKARVV